MSHDHPKSPVAYLLDHLGVVLAGAFGAAMLFLLMELGRPLLSAVEQGSTKNFLLRQASLLIFALVVAIAYILRLRGQLQEPLASKFDFDEYGGFYIDRKTKQGVCAHCLAKGVVVHLIDVEGNKLCNACRSPYRGKLKSIAGTTI